ncbi:MAG: LysR substrate-binding domain-containing protein [Myxococcota bacterium]
MERDLAPPSDELSGFLRAVVPSYEIEVATWTGALLRDHPKVRLELTIEDRPLDLVAEGQDVQLVVHRPELSQQVRRRIHVLHAKLAAHESYIQRCGKPSSPDDLANHECLLWAPDRLRDVWSLTNSMGDNVTVAVQGGLQSRSGAILSAALHAGIGIGPCGRGYLESTARAKGLVPILEEWSFEEASCTRPTRVRAANRFWCKSSWREQKPI